MVRRKFRGGVFSGFRLWGLILLPGNLLASTVMLWKILLAEEKRQIHRTIDATAEALSENVEQRLQGDVKSLTRLAKRWEFSGRPSREVWEADSTNFFKDSPELQAVEWIDPTMHVAWIVPPEGNGSVVGLNVKLDEERAGLVENAREHGHVMVSPPLNLIQGGKGFLIYVPIQRQGRFDGLIAGVFRVDRLTQLVPRQISDEYGMRFSSEEEAFFDRGAVGDADYRKEWGREADIQLLNIRWEAQLVPKEQTLRNLRSPLPSLVLAVGMIVTAFTIALLYAGGRTRQERERARIILASITDGLVTFDRNWNFVVINEEAERILGRPGKELKGKNVWEAIPGARDSVWHDAYMKAIRENQSVAFEIQDSENDRWFAIRAYPSAEGLSAYFRDITEQKESELAVLRTKDRLNRAQALALMGSWEIELRTSRTSWSDQMFALFGLDAAQKVPSFDDFLEMIHPQDRADVSQHMTHIVTGDLEFQIAPPKGELRYVRSVSEVVRDDFGRPVILRGMLLDITRQKKTELELQRQQAELEQANEKLELLAATDGLTGLKNHRVLVNTLIDEMERSRRTGESLSLILLDVDHFKQFNDSFGHTEGDSVLRSVAEVLKQTSRSMDTAARYGGEEFAVILPGTDAEEAIQIAERHRHGIENSNWTHRSVTASFGVATLSQDVSDPISFVAEADKALYAAKKAGRNRVAHARTLDDHQDAA